jgi:excisionase family DNA binding protein
MRAMEREATANGGGILPSGIAPFLADLAAVADGPLADSGNGDDVPETIEVAGWSTVAQLAAYSGHPPRTLRHWAAAGRVRAHRVGRAWLIDPESLKERP